MPSLHLQVEKRKGSPLRLTLCDGCNDSLKRILRRLFDPESGERIGPSQERVDSRTVPGDLYLSRDEVDKWAKEMIQAAKDLEQEVCLMLSLCGNCTHLLKHFTGRSRL